MRALLLCTLAAVALASCSQASLEAPEPRDLTRVRVEGLEGVGAAKVAALAGGTQIPNEYLDLSLPAPSGKGEVTMGVVPWILFEGAQKAKTLGDLHPANITDLLALQSSPEGRSVLARYKRACAPVKLFKLGMPSITDGTRMGLYSAESCEWAIVVVVPEEKATNHVL